MIQAGGDGSLRYQPDTQFTFDPNSASDYHYGRQAAHHILYTIANSKAMISAMPDSKLTGMLPMWSSPLWWLAELSGLS